MGTLTTCQLTDEQYKNSSVVTFTYGDGDNKQTVSIRVHIVTGAVIPSAWSEGNPDISGGTDYVTPDIFTQIIDAYTLNEYLINGNGGFQLSDSLDEDGNPSCDKKAFYPKSSDPKDLDWKLSVDNKDMLTIDSDGGLKMATGYVPKAGDKVTVTGTHKQGFTVSLTLVIVDEMPTAEQYMLAKNTTITVAESETSINTDRGLELIKATNIPESCTVGFVVAGGTMCYKDAYGNLSNPDAPVDATQIKLTETEEEGIYKLGGIRTAGWTADKAGNTYSLKVVPVIYNANGNIIQKDTSKSITVNVTYQITKPTVTFKNTSAATPTDKGKTASYVIKSAGSLWSVEQKTGIAVCDESGAQIGTAEISTDTSNNTVLNVTFNDGYAVAENATNKFTVGIPCKSNNGNSTETIQVTLTAENPVLKLESAFAEVKKGDGYSYAEFKGTLTDGWSINDKNSYSFANGIFKAKFSQNLFKDGNISQGFEAITLTKGDLTVRRTYGVTYYKRPTASAENSITLSADGTSADIILKLNNSNWNIAGVTTTAEGVTSNFDTTNKTLTLTKATAFSSDEETIPLTITVTSDYLAGITETLTVPLNVKIVNPQFSVIGEEAVSNENGSYVEYDLVPASTKPLSGVNFTVRDADGEKCGTANITNDKLAVTFSPAISDDLGAKKDFTVSVPFQVTIDGQPVDVYKKISLTALKKPLASAVLVTDSAKIEEGKTEYKFEMNALEGGWEYDTAGELSTKAGITPQISSDGNLVLTFDTAPTDATEIPVTIPIIYKNNGTEVTDFISVTVYLTAE